jgi:hypothetical protein
LAQFDPTHTSAEPFHLQPTNFSLDQPEHLTGAQLALAWIAHPDYNPIRHERAIKRAWNKLRHPSNLPHQIGQVEIRPGPNNDWPKFEAISLKRFNPTRLDKLASEQLAVSDWVWL